MRLRLSNHCPTAPVPSPAYYTCLAVVSPAQSKVSARLPEPVPGRLVAQGTAESGQVAVPRGYPQVTGRGVVGAQVGSEHRRIVGGHRAGDTSGRQLGQRVLGERADHSGAQVRDRAHVDAPRDGQPARPLVWWRASPTVPTDAVSPDPVRRQGVQRAADRRLGSATSPAQWTDPMPPSSTARTPERTARAGIPPRRRRGRGQPRRDRGRRSRSGPSARPPPAGSRAECPESAGRERRATHRPAARRRSTR